MNIYSKSFSRMNCHLFTTLTALNLLSVPYIKSTNGGVFSFNGCAITTYTRYESGFFMWRAISIADLALNVCGIGIPVELLMGGTGPVISFNDASYSAFGSIPLPSSDKTTFIGALTLVKYSDNSLHLSSPSTIFTLDSLM